jgi:hypothetical protein
MVYCKNSHQSVNLWAYHHVEVFQLNSKCYRVTESIKRRDNQGMIPYLKILDLSLMNFTIFIIIFLTWTCIVQWKVNNKLPYLIHLLLCCHCSILFCKIHITMLMWHNKHGRNSALPGKFKQHKFCLVRNSQAAPNLPRTRKSQTAPNMPRTDKSNSTKYALHGKVKTAQIQTRTEK